MYGLRFKKSVIKDLKRIGEENAARIMKEIRQKLVPDPRCGKPLKGQDGILWSFRCGDFRVLYNFSDRELFILIIRIGHRRDIYKDR